MLIEAGVDAEKLTNAVLKDRQTDRQIRQTCS